MPRGDRTGPRGMGAMTGGAAGFCAGFGMPGYANSISGRGVGMGFRHSCGFGGSGFGGGGFGGRRFGGGNQWLGVTGWPGYGVQAAPYQQFSAEAEKQALKNQAEMLQTEMTNIQKRLDEMESDTKEE